MRKINANLELDKKRSKIQQKSILGGSWAVFGKGLGKDLEPLGGSWAAFWVPFFMLVFGMVFKSAPGGFFAGSCVDFSRFRRDLGRLLGEF